MINEDIFYSMVTRKYQIRMVWPGPHPNQTYSRLVYVDTDAEISQVLAGSPPSPWPPVVTLNRYRIDGYR